MKNWRGCKNVEFVYHNEWSDPDLVYDGYTFNYWDVENAMWEMFLEETWHSDNESGNVDVENEFDLYVQENAEDYLEDVVYGGYFSNGSKSWHDNSD